MISVRDNENNGWKRNAKKQQQQQQKNPKKDIKEQGGDGNYSKRVRSKWFCCAFKLDLLQVICKTSLIFKSNFELALSIILKQRELYETKYKACRGGV